MNPFARRPLLAPLEAEGREQQQRDGHGDDDGINHTRLDRPLRGRRKGGGSPTLLPRGYTNGEGGWPWAMADGIIPGAIDQTNKTRIGLGDQIQFRLIREGNGERRDAYAERQLSRAGIGRQRLVEGRQGLAETSVASPVGRRWMSRYKEAKKGQERNAQRYGGSTRGGKV